MDILEGKCLREKQLIFHFNRHPRYTRIRAYIVLDIIKKDIVVQLSSQKRVGKELS